MPGVWARGPRRRSAGGQEEQPWLVNSSITALACRAGCGVSERPGKAETAVANAMTAQPAPMHVSDFMISRMQEAKGNFRQKRLTTGHNSVTAKCQNSSLFQGDSIYPHI